MSKFSRRLLLRVYELLYRLLRPLVFARSAQQAHNSVVRLMQVLDNHNSTQLFIRIVNKSLFPTKTQNISNVLLPHQFILAAGFVKGIGFETEEQALKAVQDCENIIPGWKTMPNLVGPVEFGSYTRHPRVGNDGTVIWRDSKTQSTQNRVGLRNPGAIPAAIFLSKHKNELPDIFGINIAVSPGVNNEEQEIQDVVESISIFLEQGVYPSWFTLNLSCPNTEDDPENNQTESKTRKLCKAILGILGDIPLWVKISPSLTTEQYKVLMQVFDEVGVHAVVATNTLAMPTPDNPSLNAGVGGGQLHSNAVKVVQLLAKEKEIYNYDVNIIACGGIQDYSTYKAYSDSGIAAVQYMSALVFRGPLAAALILNEV